MLLLLSCTKVQWRKNKMTDENTNEEEQRQGRSSPSGISTLVSLVWIFTLGAMSRGCMDKDYAIPNAVKAEREAIVQKYESRLKYQINMDNSPIATRICTNGLQGLVLQKNNGQSIVLLEKEGKYFTLEQLKQLDQKKLEEDYRQQKTELEQRYKNSMGEGK